MIVKDEFLSKLRRYFSLNLYEVKIWAALLSRGISTAGELSDIANVPRSRSYDVLESLEKKGFVVMKLGKPIKYIAIPPVEVVERVKKNTRIEADDRLKRLETLKGSDTLKELVSLHSKGVELIEPTELSGSITGRHNLYSHLDLTLRNAKKSVVICTTDKGLLRKAEGLKPTIEKLAKSGVSVRIAAPITKDNKHIVDELKDVAEVRNTNSRSRFAIVDGKEMVFMILDDKNVHPNYDVGIWINSPFFASHMEELFEGAWKSMKPGK